MGLLLKYSSFKKIIKISYLGFLSLTLSTDFNFFFSVLKTITFYTAKGPATLVFVCYTNQTGAVVKSHLNRVILIQMFNFVFVIVYVTLHIE